MDDQQTMARVREFLDRAEINDCLMRYGRGMDRFDRDLARSCYHPDAIDNHGPFCGPAEDFIDWAVSVPGGQFRHQHYISNLHIDLDGDQAHAESYFLFVATDLDPAAPLKMFGGRYVDRFERRAGKWAIAARKCVTEWRTTSPSLTTEAVRAEDEVAFPISRDRNDVSYMRPLVADVRS
jgi:hypothetical protein